VELDGVHCRHCQPGAVDDAADVAIELDEGDPGTAGFDLGDLFLIHVSQLLELRVPKGRVVI
jgi:hypothetical protein